MPREFAHAVPARRRKVVRMDRAGRFRQPRLRSHFMAVRWCYCVTETRIFVKLGVPFQEPVDFAHHILGRPARHSEGHVRAVELDFLVALMLSSPAPLAVQSGHRAATRWRGAGTGGLSVMRGSGGSSTLWPATRS